MWKKVQEKLNLTADGIPGPKTFNAVASYAVGRQLNIPFWAPELKTPERLADFIAQTAHETGNYKHFEENLNYSAEGALKTWPSHFNAALAKKAHRNPELVAEIAYGVQSRQGHGRMGNNKPGDGWKYRGRGALQLTGKANYGVYGGLTGLPLLTQPELAADPSTSLKIALAYYKKNGIFAAVDKRDYITARRKVNGGTIGMAHVNDIRAKVLSLFK